MVVGGGGGGRARRRAKERSNKTAKKGSDKDETTTTTHKKHDAPGRSSYQRALEKTKRGQGRAPVLWWALRRSSFCHTCTVPHACTDVVTLSCHTFVLY